MIKIHSKGSFKNTLEFLTNAANTDKNIIAILNKYGNKGVNALAANTPFDTGKTSASWYYTVDKTNKGYSITWYNSNVVDGVSIAVILEYGHGTKNGGYVQGTKYIEKSLNTIFENIADEAWKEVTG